jgi:hypothetical protein
VVQKTSKKIESVRYQEYRKQNNNSIILINLKFSKYFDSENNFKETIAQKGLMKQDNNK